MNKRIKLISLICVIISVSMVLTSCGLIGDTLIDMIFPEESTPVGYAQSTPSVSTPVAPESSTPVAVPETPQISESVPVTTPEESVTVPVTTPEESVTVPATTPEESVTEPETDPTSCPHNYIPTSVRKVSCTVDGYTVYTCSFCGDGYVGDVVKAEGHRFGEWVTEKIPTQSETGSDIRSCTVCGATETRVTSTGQGLVLPAGSGSYGYYDLARYENREELQALYRDMLSAAVEFSADRSDIEMTDDMYVFAYIDVSGYSMSLEEMVSVWKVFVYENPIFYWLSNELYIGNGKFRLAVSEYYAKGAVRAASDEAIAEMTAEAVGRISPVDSELEIALILHDFLRERITYARNSVTGAPESAPWAHNIDGAAMGRGVCEAYAKAYAYLCRLCGVDNILISGYASEAHAWNYVSIDGLWYAVDVTWDDTDSDYVAYTYFGLSEDSIGKSHVHDKTDVFGITYLYSLPETSAVSAQPVLLTENGAVIDTFISPEAAFAEMTDESGVYVMTFYLDDTVIGTGVLPSVSSITFVGMNGSIDENSYYGDSTLTFTGKVTASGDITFENVCLTADVELGGNKLTTDGFYCELNGEIIGSDGSLIEVNTEYLTVIGQRTEVKIEVLRGYLDHSEE